MGVNCSDLSVCQLFVILLVSLNLRIVLNSDLVFSGDEDTCDVPWRSFGSSSSCYLLGPHSMTWGEAWQFCFKSGGFMLEIESEEEHSLLTGRNESFSCNINACMMNVWHFPLEKKKLGYLNYTQAMPTSVGGILSGSFLVGTTGGEV